MRIWGQVLYFASNRDAKASAHPRPAVTCGDPKRHGDRGAWMTAAHDTHGYTLAEIAAAVGLHYASVSRIIKARRQDDNARYKT